MLLTLKLRSNVEKYEIELIEQSPKLNLYSIRFEGSEYSEIEKFVLNFSEISEYKEDLDVILAWLENIATRGALERYFRPESSYGSGVKAIPISTNNLRLYCIRLSDNILIVGNGGVKDVDKWQNSSQLSPMVKLLEDTEKYIKYRLRNGSIYIGDNNEIIGNLTFTRNNNEEK